MMESRPASPEVDQIRARTAESIGRSIALILDGIERRQDARDTALCRALPQGRLPPHAPVPRIFRT